MYFVGLCGLNCSGKTTVVNHFKDNKDFGALSLSDMIREELRSRNQEISRNNLRTVGNELRENYGSAVLAERVIKYVEKQTEKKNWVIDSIRHPSEAQVFIDSKYPFLFIKIDCPIEQRYKRALSRKRGEEESISFEEFKEKEDRELHSEKEYSQQLLKTFEKANITIVNEAGVEELQKKLDLAIEEFTKKLKNKDNN
ncbi:hypothetical protein M0813_26421 [Anaeramoeba flamelloides]|uniref:Uncharacterized protein n=1 Tax=Anaeramoeba flamelloides TaxID=1746091 RepID=A0AAV7Z535_9EUKA|nr:hypothetical protein M0812_17773 [Anaeramoeba flamelloides]KAJ6238451.1 hypothetical protein M0813_26421 [Anaeramoeba flamelloides]